MKKKQTADGPYDREEKSREQAKYSNGVCFLFFSLCVCVVFRFEYEHVEQFTYLVISVRLVYIWNVYVGFVHKCTYGYFTDLAFYFSPNKFIGFSVRALVCASLFNFYNLRTLTKCIQYDLCVAIHNFLVASAISFLLCTIWKEVKAVNAPKSSITCSTTG